MDTHLVLTVIGRDRPGLVNAVSETVTAGGGNWLETRMASLAGQFAGMLHVAVPRDKAEALIAALGKLEHHGLKIVVARAGDVEDGVSAQVMQLELVGLDRPGIVRDLSCAFAALGVSIKELETEREAGSFSGEMMFKARAQLQLPEGLAAEEVRRTIERLANEMMVDLTVQP